MEDSTFAPLPTKSRTITLYALGSNGNFQLGLPHDDDTEQPQKCIFNVTHTPLSTLSPSTPPFEKSTSSSCIPIGQALTHTEVPLYPGEEIKDLKAGGNHTLLLTTHGRVFAAGSNEYGQLALLPPSSSSSDSNSSPAELITRPAPGFHLLPWTGPDPHVPITHIAATFTATMLVASHTTLYTVGHGPKGELGLGPSITTSTIPTRVFDIRDVEGPNSRIIQIAACMDHVLLLSSTGVVSGFGASRKGQLGEPLFINRSGVIEGGVWWGVEPTSMHVNPLPFRISQIATGRDFTTVAGRGNGQVRAFGKGNREFNLRPECEATSRAFEVPNVEVGSAKYRHVHEETIRTHAGWSSVTIQHQRAGEDHFTGYFMTDTVSSTSRRQPKTVDRGQLPPPHLPGPVTLAVGSEHTIALVGDAGGKRVVCWGWGEHGNCGSPVDERGVVESEKMNVLFRSGERRRDSESGRMRKGDVIGVGAGCGTSFFWVEEEDAEEEGG